MSNLKISQLEQVNILENTNVFPVVQLGKTKKATVQQIIDIANIPPTQVNSDWNATDGLAEIFNKPSIPTSSEMMAYVDLKISHISNNICYFSTIPSGAEYKLCLVRKNAYKLGYSDKTNQYLSKISGKGIRGTQSDDSNKYWKNLTLAKSARPEILLTAGSNSADIIQIILEFSKLEKIELHGQIQSGVFTKKTHYFSKKVVIPNLGHIVKKNYGKVYLCIFKNGKPFSNTMQLTT